MDLDDFLDGFPISDKLELGKKHRILFRELGNLEIAHCVDSYGKGVIIDNKYTLVYPYSLGSRNRDDVEKDFIKVLIDQGLYVE